MRPASCGIWTVARRPIADANECEANAERGAERGDEQALREHRTHHIPARRADSGAHRHLPPALHATCEEYACHVGRSDQQHHHDRSEEQEERRANRTDTVGLEWNGASGFVALIHEYLGEAVVETREFLACRLHGRPRGETADRKQIVVVTAAEFRCCEPHRLPDVGTDYRGPLWNSKATRKDPDDRRRLAIDLNGLRYDAWIAAKIFPPEFFTDNDHAILAGRVVGRREETSVERARAENIEKITGDSHAADLNGLIAKGDEGGTRRDRRHGSELTRSSSKVLEVRSGKRPGVGVGLWRYPVDRDQPVRILERKWPQQRSIDGARDRRGRADTNGETENRRQRERRGAPKTASGRANVLVKKTHIDSPWVSAR